MNNTELINTLLILSFLFINYVLKLMKMSTLTDKKLTNKKEKKQ